MTNSADNAAELAAWLKLCSIPGLGGERQRTLMQAFGLPEQVLAAGYPAWRGVIGVKADLLVDPAALQVAEQRAEQALQWVALPGNRILPLHDPEYPAALLDIPDPPSLLYVRGDAAALSKPAIAIVGSRHATSQGRQTARAFARALGEAGYCIISGLALGIDAAAHEGALAGGCTGSTLAVVGTGADRLYPAANRALAEKIIGAGGLISEFPLGTPALPANFPRRNRIIAGLARAVLVVEAAPESGSLITARLAMEQGREVMAIPGSIHSPLSKGCHRLIKQGAKLVETVDDILEELGHWVVPMQPVPPVGKRDERALSAEMKALLARIAPVPTPLDQIIAETGLSTGVVLNQLLQLELEGWVQSLGGDCYVRTAG